MTTIDLNNNNGAPTIGPEKAEAKNDGLAVAALIFSFLFWPLALVFGHVSNRAAKAAGRKRSVLAIAGLIISYSWIVVIAIIVIAAIAGAHSGS